MTGGITIGLPLHCALRQCCCRTAVGFTYSAQHHPLVGPFQAQYRWPHNICSHGMHGPCRRGRFTWACSAARTLKNSYRDRPCVRVAAGLGITVAAQRSGRRDRSAVAGARLAQTTGPEYLCAVHSCSWSEDEGELVNALRAYGGPCPQSLLRSLTHGMFARVEKSADCRVPFGRASQRRPLQDMVHFA